MNHHPAALGAGCLLCSMGGRWPAPVGIRRNPLSMKFSPLFFACLAAGTASAAPELTGVLSVTQEPPKFNLRETSTQETSGWIGLGRRFSGYTLDSYDASTSILTVSRPNDTLKLRLLASTVVVAAPTPTPDQASPEVSDTELEARGLQRVKSGDSGAKIARVHGLTLPELLALNPGVNWNRLRVGQLIRFRAGEEPVPVSPR